ncbi:hypothetical protein B484DRAFT_187089 [Ochromonadaceae sp. CCMP2298]|nr:hypothetical protein B484DRAFT_187089 [Ochromonadaceae sp. CCMP2298]|mmetsp:Transcript_15658/g.34604  ORF Transcript_15658/g.34604 Transcript_15658/m.34604 type:complete len:405 (-) Transcript_15658:218-1432(-)|eukprot:CAMPEP_0173252260 /NCGR_PEP_ID=MMETSP1142-20121109/20625_1 /TAXON_ID=483371 /ORGANISM="non described non described, Strain CCMP2298" /LENGTH=404 /DNA_ID=CAMNT_0014185277 /DNA_START=180 /DNA_END=1394 /DNA_ORIENTATION=+
MPGFVFEGLTFLSFSLAVIYACLAVIVTRMLIILHNDSPDFMNTRKLFVMTCLTTAILRCMSFSSMGVLDLLDRDFSIAQGGQKPSLTEQTAAHLNAEFFDKAFLVLFDFPDFCCISAYVLLIVVWAESYLRSRRHWLSAYRFRRVWMLIYLLFNVLLYSVQVALYLLLFFPSVARTSQLNLIYCSLALFNLGLPLAWLLTYLYLAIQFSGFPWASEDAKRRLLTLSRLGVLWTLARLGWGVVALTSVVQGWLVHAQSRPGLYTCVLVSIFCLAEVLPICLSVQLCVLNDFSDQDLGCHMDKLTRQTGNGDLEMLPGTPGEGEGQALLARNTPSSHRRGSRRNSRSSEVAAGSRRSSSIAEEYWLWEGRQDTSTSSAEEPEGLASPSSRTWMGWLAGEGPDPFD